MIFNLDTNDYKNIKVTLTDDDYEQEVSTLVQEFCFAMSSFFVDFAMKLNCDTEQAKGLKEVVLDCADRNIEHLLNEGLLDDKYDEELEEEIDELAEAMIDSGFSNAEITNIAQLVRDAGSMEAATEYLKEFALESGIDIGVDGDN